MRIARYLKIQLLALDQYFLVPFFSRHPWLASLYYVVVSRKFGREHKAVLSGRNRYYASLRDPADTSFLLRRNTHRLEKGLIMRPRRDVFALDYIEETVNQYAVCKELSAVTETELQWVHDVLSDYFACVGSSPAIDKARALFQQCQSEAEAYQSWVPYESDARAPLSTDYEAFFELCRRRRSVRWYDDRAVPRDLLEQAVEAAAQAPSVSNASLFDFRFLIILRMQQR